MKTIVIAGASGFIGAHLSRHFESLGWKVKTIGRSRSNGTWDDQSSLIRTLEGSDAVVNLAGKSVNCRFTRSNVEELIRSRVETTAAIGEAIAHCKQPPAVWINASGASIYREHVSAANNEQSPTDGEGTMAEVARRWEQAFFEATTPHTRKVALRITLVLSRDGGVLPIYLKLVRLGQGGRQGSGSQMMSWIHVDDLARLVESCIHNSSVSGPVNAVAPQCLTNKEFMTTIRHSMGVKLGVGAPSFLITLGTFLIGAPHELVLRGMWVQSNQLTIINFSFLYPNLIDVLSH